MNEFVRARNELLEYVRVHTRPVVKTPTDSLSGEFACKVDAGEFDIAVLPGASATELRRLTEACPEGLYRSLNPLTQQCDNLDVTGWLGDEGYARRYVALATGLKLGSSTVAKQEVVPKYPEDVM